MQLKHRAAPHFALAALVALGLAAAPAANAQSYTLTTLHSFTGTDGAGPLSSVTLDSDGTLYGTTQNGGSSNNGTIYSYNTATGAFNSLHSFDNTDGNEPFGRVAIGSGGVLYGATQSGGAQSDGVIFSYDTANNSYATLHSFTEAVDGKYPHTAATLGSDGAFYGTTSHGNSTNYGTVFSYSTTSGAFSTLHNFTSSDGAYPDAGPTLGSDGTIYGTTAFGGAGNSGTIFSCDPTTGAVTTLHSFAGVPDGVDPVADLTFGTDGTLYGTTYTGGVNNDGAIFSYNPTSGAYSVLHSFDGSDGGNSYSALTLGPNGTFYGATSGIGGGLGTVYSYNPTNGAFTTIHSFTTTEGNLPEGDLAVAPNGTIYGTTSGNATIFALVPAPEPSPAAALAIGLLTLGTLALRARKRNAA